MTSIAVSISSAEWFLGESPSGSLRPKKVSSRSPVISVYNSETACRSWGSRHCIPGLVILCKVLYQKPNQNIGVSIGIRGTPQGKPICKSTNVWSTCWTILPFFFRSYKTVLQVTTSHFACIHTLYSYPVYLKTHSLKINAFIFCLKPKYVQQDFLTYKNLWTSGHFPQNQVCICIYVVFCFLFFFPSKGTDNFQQILKRVSTPNWEILTQRNLSFILFLCGFLEKSDLKYVFPHPPTPQNTPMQCNWVNQDTYF